MRQGKPMSGASDQRRKPTAFSWTRHIFAENESLNRHYASAPQDSPLLSRPPPYRRRNLPRHQSKLLCRHRGIPLCILRVSLDQKKQIRRIDWRIKIPLHRSEIPIIRRTVIARDDCRCLNTLPAIERDSPIRHGTNKLDPLADSVFITPHELAFLFRRQLGLSCQRFLVKKKNRDIGMVLQTKRYAHFARRVFPVIGNEHVRQTYTIGFRNFVGIAGGKTL